MPPFSRTNQPSKRRRKRRAGAKSRKGSKVISLGGRKVRIRYDICAVGKGARRARRCPTGRRRKKR